MNKFTSCKDCTRSINDENSHCFRCIHYVAMDYFKPKAKKVELECGIHTFNVHGSVKSHTANVCSQSGIVRQTKEQAELASKRMIRVNRLSALVSQLGGEKYFEESAYCIRRQYGIWGYYYDPYYFHLEKVYMNKETAEEICLLLNDGLFSLDEE